jgi:ribosome-binding protein aMBF1 (putative translation factor)
MMCPNLLEMDTDMNETIKGQRIERTAEQRAEEKRIREMHRQQPVREMPADTMSGDDVAQMLAFAAGVRREREAQGLSVEQLAEKAGIDPGVLSRFEMGQAFNPTAATLFRLARALGRDLHLALNGIRI